ncbi:thiosulfate oxidation carrier protein SoxY [Nitrogeniibacter mangrovi]|uniref:Thiosulfate oxidation carrier protein SoxY n=1 Tax=Nitrogeniibacter mangrovi TaxID=2016596 RepID=A0A6C1B6G4_9RHOO|nr:thiosulfate oxidation carrier protein SoxY [Nitrogeniibacter mangrovi]QID18629.1 thiosulfate oxidation carrier protein SoxY [Nitrogeniibacter mangrovi]
MNQSRREALKAGAGMGLFGVLVAAGLLKPEVARAEWNKVAFDAKSLDEALKALGASDAAESGDVVLTAADIAENGAVVPVAVSSKLPGAQQIAILVEKNPNTLAATFTLPEGTMADIQTRVKMGQTSNVFALVKAGDKFYMAKKEIKVTLGGCGG